MDTVTRVFGSLVRLEVARNTVSLTANIAPRSHERQGVTLMNHRPCLCVFVLMAALLGGCTEGAAGPTDLSPDVDASVEADAAAEADAAVEADAGPPFATISTKVQLVLLTQNGEPNTEGLLAGATVCVHPRRDSLPCVRGHQSTRVTLRVPEQGRFSLRVTGEGITPTLTPVAAYAAEDNPFIFASLLSAGTYAQLHAEVGIAVDDAKGALLVFEASGLNDPHARTGVEVSAPGAGGTIAYHQPDGTYDPTLNATTDVGSMGILGATPGLQPFTAIHPTHGCVSLNGAAWLIGDTSEFEALIEAGAVTTNVISCRTVIAAPDFECDVVAQDCEGEGDRCTMRLPADAPYATMCEPAGDKALNEPCTVQNGEAGDDDCDSGLICAKWNLTPNTGRVCRAYCNGDADCDADFFCNGPAKPNANLAAEVPGGCVPDCDPFENQCVEGVTCVPVNVGNRDDGLRVKAFCKADGDLEAGAVCSVDELCSPGLACIPWADGERHCSAACNDANPCEEFECFPDDHVGWGFCRP